MTLFLPIYLLAPSTSNLPSYAWAYLCGTYTLWKGVELWDVDSKGLVGKLGRGKMVRVMGRIRPIYTRTSQNMVLIQFVASTMGFFLYNSVTCLWSPKTMPWSHHLLPIPRLAPYYTYSLQIKSALTYRQPQWANWTGNKFGNDCGQSR